MNNTEIQQRAINKLNRLKVGALFMALGTGKTKHRVNNENCDLVLYLGDLREG